MNKFLSAFLMITIVLLLITGCTSQQADQSSSAPSAASSAGEETSKKERTDVNVLTIAGPTGIGMAKLMQENQDGKTANNYDFTITSTPSDVLSAIMSGSADIAACPINLASNIFSKSKQGVQILAINTLGVLYVVTNGVEINDFSDLDGKSIVASGEGATPEFAMKYLSEAYGISFDLQFVDEFATAAGMIASGECEIALLAEPSVTSALMKNNELKVSLDLTAIWRQAGADGKIPNVELAQGCVIVRKEFAEAHPEAVKAFLSEYAASVSYMSAGENLDSAATLCETYGIVPKAAIAKKAIPNCNLVCITGSEMKTMATENLKVFFQYKPASIGGAMPADDFYYAG